MSEPTTDMVGQLAAYLAARDKGHQEAAERVTRAMTPREQRLVREAAVMGYVRGGLNAHRISIPPDSEIVREVIDACIAHGDLYPVMSAMANQGSEETP